MTLTTNGHDTLLAPPARVTLRAAHIVIVFAGGIPLKHSGRVVGAIGVSGGSVEEDQEVAEAGVAAF